MAHLANTCLLPRVIPDPASVLFPVALRAYPGKPIVCMVPRETAWGGIELPDQVSGKYQADLGVVYDPGKCKDLATGDMVVLKPYTGKWMDHRDDRSIPEGREVRILGTVDDALDNVLAVLEVA